MDELAEVLASSRTGSIKLRSGYWRWSATEKGDGYTLIFRHAMRPHDEMKTWVTAGDSGGILAAALHPVYRVWEDFDGLLWILALDFASLQRDSPLWLTFRNPLREMSAEVHGGTSLGDLTSDELARYLREAG